MEISRGAISLTVNGQPRIVDEETTVAGLLDGLMLNPRLVVVELNRTILRNRDEFTSLRLHDGDNVEIVHFVGGG
jgi:thiamine biosynthesis protein ThiS